MIFLDSSFLVAVEVETDQNHEKAVKIRDDIIEGKFGKVFISDCIFDETVTVTFGRTKDLEKAVLAGTNLRNSAEIINIDERDFEAAWEIFKKQKDTTFSFTDCTNVALMRKESIENIATFDEDFQELKEMNVVS